MDIIPRSQLTCVDPFVDLQVLGPGEYLPAAGEGAGEGLLSCVDPKVVDQFVLGFERFVLSAALLPVTGVIRLLGSTDVVNGQMSDDVVHGVEDLPAHLARLLVDPLAGHLLVERLPHVPEEAGAHPVHVGAVDVVVVSVARAGDVREEEAGGVVGEAVGEHGGVGGEGVGGLHAYTRHGWLHGRHPTGEGMDLARHA